MMAVYKVPVAPGRSAGEGGVLAHHGAPTHRAMADATSSACPGGTFPSCRTKRANDTDFVWNASAPESLLSPLSLSAGINTNQGKLAYGCFQSVSGTTI